MEKEMFSKLASKVGITSARVSRKAEEYLRLSEVKCTGLGDTTATSKAVICLQLAATSMRLPIDKEYAIKLSGLNKKVYRSNLKSMECLLGLESHLCIRDLAVQYGCVEAVKVASQIIGRYEASLPPVQQQDLDLSKPLFITAALHTACKCLKIKLDARKLAASSGVRKSIFDRLCTQMQTLGQDICTEVPLKESIKTPHKRTKTLMECIEQAGEEDEGQSASQKKRLENSEEQDSLQDYEQWKRKILEKALQSN
ncbi:origin recognition complex subunit 6 [Aplochiton taeniatus]